MRFGESSSFVLKMISIEEKKPSQNPGVGILLWKVALIWLSGFSYLFFFLFLYRDGYGYKFRVVVLTISGVLPSQLYKCGQ